MQRAHQKLLAAQQQRQARKQQEERWVLGANQLQGAPFGCLCIWLISFGGTLQPATIIKLSHLLLWLCDCPAGLLWTFRYSSRKLSGTSLKLSSSKNCSRSVKACSSGSRSCNRGMNQTMKMTLRMLMLMQMQMRSLSVKMTSSTT